MCIRDSHLTVKIFLITTLLFLAVSAVTYGFIIMYVPRYYIIEAEKMSVNSVQNDSEKKDVYKRQVLKHELANYFHSLTAYIFGAFLLVFVGIGAMLYNIQAAVSNFEYVLQFVSLGFVVIVPILTMRVIAEERKQKTCLLYTYSFLLL